MSKVNTRNINLGRQSTVWPCCAVNRGFTLIELLIVIAIIALLTAILFPVFSRTREKARQTTCASNLKQLGLAMLQYTQDFDERFPSGSYIWNGSYRGRGWAGQIYPYAKSSPLYACPNDPTTTIKNQKISYVYNAYIPRNQTLLTGLNQPTMTIVLAEVNYGYAGLMDKNANTITDWTLEAQSAVAAGIGNEMAVDNGSTTYATGMGYNDTTVLTTTYMKTPVGRHSNGANYLFGDGHVKWLPPSGVSVGSMFNANNTPDSCGSTTTPATTTCTDSRMQATYNRL